MKNEQKLYKSFIISYNIVVLIPMLVISLFVVNIFWKQQISRADAEVAAIFKRQESCWEQWVFSIKAFNTSCKYDKKYHDQYMKNMEYFYDICEELGKQAANAPFIDTISIYDRNREIVLTEGRKVTPELFFSSACKLDPSVLLELQDGEISVFAAELNTDSGKGIVLAAPIQTWGENGSETKVFLYTIKNDTLRPQFGQVLNDGVTLLTAGNRVVYSSSDEIPADMVLEESGLGIGKSRIYQSPVTHEKYRIYEQALGEELSAVILLPERELHTGMLTYIGGYIVWFLCSLLIGMGLLLYFTRSHYAVYEKLLYTQKALTTERDRLRQVGCLYEMLLKSDGISAEYRERCLENGIRIDRRYKFFIAFSEEDEGGRYELVREKLELEGISELYDMDLMNEVYVCLVCSDEEEGLVEKCKELTEQKIAVGRLVEDISELNQSLEKALKKYNAYAGKEEAYPEREIASFEKAVAENNVLKGELLLEQLAVMAEGMDEVASIGVLLSIASALGINARELLETMSKADGTIGEKVKQELLKLRRTLPERMHKQEGDGNYKKRSIEELLAYVDEHYMDDNFSVKYVAYYFDTSVSNISHFFKKNTGMSISQYVEITKIEKAKQMMKESSRNIREIAMELGYASSTTFIEMFKRYENMTPGKYREMTKEEEK